MHSDREEYVLLPWNPRFIMTHCQQRLLLLFVLLAFPSFSFAQGSNATFTLTTASLATVCADSLLEWSGGLPPYWVYMARGDSPIGNNSSLDPEILFIAALNDTISVITLNRSLAQIGDVVRFRVQEHGGEGASVVAWALVIDDVCNNGGVGPPIASNIDDTVTTTKDIGASVTVSGANGLLTAPQRSNTLPHSPTNSASSRGSKPSSSGAPIPSSESDPHAQPPPPGWLHDSSSPLSTEGGGFVGRPSAFSEYHELHPSQTIVPPESGRQSDTGPKPTLLSAQTIGAIAGTVIMGIVLWVLFATLRWRRRNRPIALKTRESPPGGSMRGLLAPACEAPDHTHLSLTAETLTTRRMQTRTFKSAPVIEWGGAVVPSYNEAIGLHYPPNTRDPL